jgi:uncharacterized protein (DUF433 family)
MEDIVNKKWLKMGAITLAIGMLAVASVAVYAQDSVVLPAAGDMVFGGRDGGRGGFGRGGDALAMVAEQLGIEQAALVTELQAGKTIAQLAEEKGVSTADIVAAVIAARQEMLTSAVEAGTLTQAQADARLALLQADAEAMLDKTFTFSDGRGPGMGGFGGGDGVLAIVAEQLGIEQAALVTELQAGKTIAELAEANSVSTDDIVAAIVATHQERLDAAVAEGRLTQEQADAHLVLATAQIEAMLDQPLTGRGLGQGGFGGPNGDGQRGGGRGHGNGFPGNPPGGAPVAPDASPEVTTTPNV